MEAVFDDDVTSLYPKGRRTDGHQVGRQCHWCKVYTEQSIPTARRVQFVRVKMKGRVFGEREERGRERGCLGKREGEEREIVHMHATI